MILNVFPISGLLKEPLLIMESFIVFFFLELAAIFWMRVKSEKINELKSLQEKAYIWLFFGYSIMWVFIIIGDYYVDTIYLRTLILNLGFFIQIICFLIFMRIMEKYKVFLKKYLFTKICSIFTIVYIISFFIVIYYATFISSIFWIIFIVFFTIYLNELNSAFYIKQDLGNFKSKALKFYIGVILTSIGYQLTNRFVVGILGLEIRLMGDLLQLAGLVFLFLFFISIPSFSEYEWRDKIDSIFIMHKSGLFIYKKLFREITSPINESLITGTLTTLKMMLEKFSGIENISIIIKKKGKTIVIQPGKFIYGVLICDDELDSLKILLSKFIKKIETIYSNTLTRWDGNLKVFRPVEDIINEFFLIGKIF